MIKQIEITDLLICLDVIHNSFITVAEEFGLTNENCPTNGAFMPLSRLEKDYQDGDMMYTASAGNRIVGFAQLANKGNCVYELKKLAVLPASRHNGYGKQLIEFACLKVKALGGNKITIGIIENNKRLRDWYSKNGFIHIGTREFQHLPFTVGFMEMSV